MWLKTAISSNACGTSTLKSPLLRAFSVPDVHPRPRKRPPRCTLDCGFQTSESPALRGFVAGLRALATAGPLSCAKIERPSPLEKPSCKVRLFVQNRSRKYRQKVTATTLFQITFHRGFSTSPTNGPRSLSRAKAGTHSALLRRIAHNGSHAETGGVSDGALSLPSDTSYTFTEHPCVAGYQNGVLCRFWVLAGGALPKNAESLRDSDALMRVAVPRRRGPAGLRRPTPPAERTVLAPISPRVQLCLRRPAFPLSAFIPGA